MEDCYVLNGICYYQALLPGWRRFARFSLGLEVSSKTLKANKVLYFSFLLKDFQQSVTVVLLQDEHTLISAGAVDG